VQGALNSGKKAQARNDVQQIAAAIRAYQLEYGRLPSSVTSPSDGNEDFLAKDRSKEVIAVLTGDNPDNLNPQQRVFLEAKTTTGRKGGVDPTDKTFYDPWGEPYMIKLDTSYNNKLEYY
jgi:type II secretory pathway pseudopilin PulG